MKTVVDVQTLRGFDGSPNYWLFLSVLNPFSMSSMSTNVTFLCLILVVSFLWVSCSRSSVVSCLDGKQGRVTLARLSWTKGESLLHTVMCASWQLVPSSGYETQIPNITPSQYIYTNWWTHRLESEVGKCPTWLWCTRFRGWYLVWQSYLRIRTGFPGSVYFYENSPFSNGGSSTPVSGLEKNPFQLGNDVLFILRTLI